MRIELAQGTIKLLIGLCEKRLNYAALNSRPPQQMY